MKNLRTVMLFVVVLILGRHTLSVTASAIPMWEFLSRGEKMSYLLRIFSLQVAKYCMDSSMPDCNKNLLLTGMRNLGNMENNVLDKLDPYQRDAKGLIWRAMIKNAYNARVAHKPDEFYFSVGTDSLAISDSDINGIGEETMTTRDRVQLSSKHTGPFLVGPMVIRVYPDGRPVPEDLMRPLPRDEDMEEFKHSRIPSFEKMETNKDIFFEKQLKESTFIEPNNHGLPQEKIVHHRNNHSLFKRRLPQEVIVKRKIRYY